MRFKVPLFRLIGTKRLLASDPEEDPNTICAVEELGTRKILAATDGLIE